MKEQELMELFADLSIEEKIGQMLQLSGNFYETGDTEEAVLTGPALEMGIGEKEIFHAGSVLSVFDSEKIMDIQKRFMQKHPHHIPLLFMGDIINGYRTIFPIPLAQGCSFDPEEVKHAAEVAAEESALSGLHVTFSPMVDLVRDSRWGRVMESTGEDTYLNSCMARAMVEGYQGDDLNKKGNIAACIKHFAAYGAPTAGRDYNNVELSERTLREFYLPAYKAGIDAGAAMVMTSFNTLNHVPASGNKWLMQDILREEMGFEGVLISDWAAIEEMIAHGYAKDKKEAAKLAIEAGVDIDMVTSVYIKNLIKLLEENAISMEQIDACVLRILRLKNALGLFENPFKDLNAEELKKSILNEEHRALARMAAADSMVLVKNDGILPLQEKKDKIAVIGPYATSKHLYGFWSILGREEDTVSLEEGLKRRGLKETPVFAEGTYVLPEDYEFSGIVAGEGKRREKTEKEFLVEALEAAAAADKVVIAIGEHAYQSGEGGSRSEISIAQNQIQLLRQISKVNKNVVAVLFHGRPLDLREVEKYANAVVLAWFPGSEGGNAVWDILFGDVNPSAKLSMSMPYSIGQVPVFYNEYRTGRPFHGEKGNRFLSRYQDIPNRPLHPFGFGLSYTTFSCSSVEVSSEKLGDEGVTASVTVTNTGKKAGKEVVQLYVQDVTGSTVHPVKDMRGFEKISLEPGESRQVSFHITEDMLRYYDIQMQYICEPGEFRIYIGDSSDTENYATIVRE